MPTFTAANIPTIAPGDLFDRLFSDSTLNIRWMTPTDPVYYEVLNRPHADIALRQLIIAKAIDRINDNLGYLAQFPFVLQPKIVNGSSQANVPVKIFWDFHVSLPDKWSHVRLARVDRLDGTNGTESTGTLRFVFTGQERTDGVDSSSETALFFVSYEIDSEQTYQTTRPQPALASAISGFSDYLVAGEANTIGGTVVFKTVDTATSEMSSFLVIAAPSNSTQTYQVADTAPGGTENFSSSGMSHGTGLLASSAYNGIVTLESDSLNWIDAFNYPFTTTGSGTSVNNAVTIPNGMFTEFNIMAPASDQPTGSANGLSYPVWISKLTRDGNNLTFTFSTYNVTDTSPDPVNAVEFATLVVQRSMAGGQIVSINQTNNLQRVTGGGASLADQNFGRGHVVLSRKWDTQGSVIDAFFNSLPVVQNGVNTTTFTQAATRIGAFGISRVSKYTPTKGQGQALKGSTSRFATAVDPSDTNRFVTEKDEGLGDPINLDSIQGITADPAVNSIGYMATRLHKAVQLVVDASRVTEDDTYYDTVILPRLTILFGRAPVFGDEWYNGTRFMKYNGDAWVG